MKEKEKPEVNPKVEGLKVKKKPGRPRKLVEKQETIKVDLTKKEETKKEENAISESTTESSVLREERPELGLQEVGSGLSESNKDDNKQEEKKEETPVISEIVEEKTEEKEIEQPEPAVSQLPENVNKLVTFMKETGGDLEDYVRLNRDYSNISDDILLQEYYKNTKPHLDSDEINFLLEDKFYFDDEVEEEKAVKLKQLARKEEIAKAKSFLEETKKKYYDEIKLRPGVTQDQQKAMDFFNRYNKEQETAKKNSKDFQDQTSSYFNKNEFKGFEFNLGDKRFRYGISDVEKTSKDQSNANNFFKKFLNEEGKISDLGSYHKALYMANNPDTVAKHFYDQGVADATKDIVAKSKNINTEPRSSDPGDIFINGLKVRAISGDDSSKLKIKTKFKK